MFDLRKYRIKYLVSMGGKPLKHKAQRALQARWLEYLLNATTQVVFCLICVNTE